MAGGYPGDRDPKRADKILIGLIEAGIRHVISLMEPGEFRHQSGLYYPYVEQMEALAKKTKASVTFDQISIKDMTVPSQKEMTRILNQIDMCIKHDKSVFIHCLGGRGRTGTVVGCYLARHGIARGKQAIDKINELRRNTPDLALPSPETREQVEMVANWEEGS